MHTHTYTHAHTHTYTHTYTHTCTHTHIHTHIHTHMHTHTHAHTGLTVYWKDAGFDLEERYSGSSWSQASAGVTKVVKLFQQDS